MTTIPTGIPAGWEPVQAATPGLPAGWEAYDPATSPALPAPPQSSGFWQQYGRGLVSGAGVQNLAAIGHSLEGFGHITGTGWAIDKGAKIIGMAQQAGKAYQPDVPSYENIRLPQEISLDEIGNFLSDTSKYAGFSLGQGMGSTALPVAAGLGVAAITKSPIAGLLGGAIGPSYFQNYADVYGGLKDELKDELASGQVDPVWVAKTAALAAIPVAALDVASLPLLLGKMGLGKAAADTATKEIKASIAKAALKGAAVGSITEAGTEGAQEAISQGVQAWASGKPFFEHERIVSIIDNAIGGALTGGVIGGGAGAYGRAFPAKPETAIPGAQGEASDEAAASPPGGSLPGGAAGTTQDSETATDTGATTVQTPGSSLLASSPNASSYVPSENERVVVNIPGVPDPIAGTVQAIGDVEGEPWVRVQADDGTVVDEPLARVRISPLQPEQPLPASQAQPPPPRPNPDTPAAQTTQPQPSAPEPLPTSSTQDHKPFAATTTQPQAQSGFSSDQQRPSQSPVSESAVAPDTGAGARPLAPQPQSQPAPPLPEAEAQPRAPAQQAEPDANQPQLGGAPQEAAQSLPPIPAQSQASPPPGKTANQATAGAEDQGKKGKAGISEIAKASNGRIEVIPVGFSAAGPPATKSTDAHVSLSEAIGAHVKTGGDATLPWLTQKANEYFGGTSAEGKWTRKDLYDALEAGFNIAASGQLGAIPLGDAEMAKDRARKIRGTIDRLPTQTVRSEEQTRLQQFSTPHDYAFAVAWLANISPNDVVLEPSAGTGNIAGMARNARPREVIANEIAPGRAKLIKRVFKQSPDLGPTRVFEEDAEQLNNILPDNAKPTVVVMNPPFSRAGERMGDAMVPMTAANHIDQALKRLEPGGRLVAIVGQGMGPAAPKFAGWFKKVSQDNTIRANVGVAGKVYNKHGTNFGTRVLVIDKTPPSADNQPVVGDVENIPALIDKLAKVRDDRSPASEQPATESARAPVVEPDGRGREPDQPLRPATGDVGTGQRSGDTGAAQSVQDGNRRGSKPAAQPDTGPGESVGVGGEQPGKQRAPTGATAKPVDQPRGTEKSEASSGVGLGTDRGPTTGGKPVLPASGKQPGLNVESADAGQSGEITGEIYETYTPQRLKIAGAKAHPGELVQSAAMASVLPPVPTYRPSLPQKIIERGELSLAQLEAIVYAGQSHEQLLPNGERRGYFIGDGTGVGKGREIAGIIRDNWEQGRRKAVWITEKKTLVKDAARDWAALGGKPDDIFDIGKTKADAPLGASKGIGFITYDTLKSAARVAPKAGEPTKGTRGVTRLDQLVKWLGPDFDGVIAFDEAHNMGNSADEKGDRGTKEASQKALAGVDLQEQLPKARIVYVSATGATEVSNLGFASRLGLWGRETAFPTREKFINEISAGGVAAMELVSRDLKALGMYTARSLSFNGTEQTRVQHELSPTQRMYYDKLAEGWHVVLKNFNKALEVTGAKATGSGEKTNAQALSAARSAFWGAHQRFFNQIITSMQMPTVVKSIEEDLKAGYQAVLQVVNTNEASQKRALAKQANDEDASLEDLDMSPIDQLAQLIEHSFPVTQYETYMDGETKRSRPVMTKSGDPVQNKEAIAMRERLLDEIGSLRKVTPAGPLEILMDHFGIAKVAEVTGRKQRVVNKENAKGEIRRTVETRPANANIADADAFQAGKKPILIFSDAGGTGRSYHAERGSGGAKNRRVHYLIQPGWRADKAIQGLGRTHRTNQESAPIYRLPEIADLKGQRRFISSIARRLSQLGALTRGERKTGDQGLFKATDNLESTEAKQALYKFYMDLAHQNVPGISLAEFEEQTGLELYDREGNLKRELPPITQFLNRLLSLKIDMQNKVFDAYASRLDDVVANAIAHGTLDQGVETVKADKITKDSEEIVYTDPKSGAETKYVKLTSHIRNDPYSWADISGEYRFGRNEVKGFIRNKQSGRVYATGNANERTKGKTGEVVAQSFVQSPLRVSVIDTEHAEKNYEKLDKAQAEKLWNAEVAAVPEFRQEDLHMISGAILPVWDRIKTGGNVKVSQLNTDKGERFLGRTVPESRIGDTLKALGAKATGITSSPAEIIAKIEDDGYRVVLSNDWTLKRSRVAGEWRVEILGPNFSSAKEIIEDGVYSERISYETRYFIPVGPQGPAVLEKITKGRPIVELAAPQEKLAAPGGRDDIEYGKSGGFSHQSKFLTRLRRKLTQSDMQDYVLARGKRSGNEYMAAITPDGKLVGAGTSFEKNAINIPPSLIAALDKPGADIEWTHNHPNGEAFSYTDLIQLARRRGVAKLHVYGSSSHYEASLTPEWSGPNRRDALIAKLNDIGEWWDATANLHFIMTRELGGADISPLAHAFNQALHDIGVISYTADDAAVEKPSDNPRVLAMEAELRIKLDDLSDTAQEEEFARSPGNRGPATDSLGQGVGRVSGDGQETAQGLSGRGRAGEERGKSASDGENLRSAAGPEAVRANSNLFQSMAERWKGTVPEGIQVVDPVTARDTTWIAKAFKTPLRLFRNTVLEPLVHWGIHAEAKQSLWMKRLETRYSEAVRPIIKDEESFNKVTGALFTGDLARTALTPQALTEMGLTPVEQKAFNGVRSVLDETGRLIDQHRRKMLPQVRKRKAQVLRTMDAFLRNSGVAPEKFNAAFNRVVFLRQQLNTGNRNPQTVSDEIRALERELLDMVPADPQLIAGYKSLLDELKTLDERLAQTSVRRIAGYVPHKFFGSWRLFKKDGEDEHGKTKWKEITSDQGFFRDRDDALKAAARFKKDNPDAELKVAPKQFSWPFTDEGTQLSDAAYRRLRESIMDSTGLHGEELNDMMKGVARTWFRRRLATFTQHREGAAGYSKDLNRVMRAHVAQAVRYVTMDELKYKAINLIERSGLSPARQLMQERPILQQAVLNWWRDINGQKQTSEKFFDEWFDKPWFTPARGAMLGGALGIGVGGLANPVFGVAMGGYLGYRMYRALKSGGDFKTRALTGSMLSDMAHLKLGSFLNVASAAANLMQTPINTYPILGAKYTAIGMRLGERAIRDQFFGRSTRLAKLLTRADINSAFKIGEQQTNIFQEEGKLGKWSMWMFNSVETMNRAIAFFGAYQRAIDGGASEANAMKAASAVMQRTQFSGGMANRPEILRNTFARVPLQFKNFMAQQLAFMFGMNRGEFARFLVAMTLAAGALGLPFLQIGDILLDALFGFSPVRSIKNAAIASMAYGNMAGTFAETLARGLPAMFGVDISQRVGMGQGFFPSGMSDVTGPWLGTLKNLREMSANGAAATDYLRQLAPGLGSPLRALEAAANGMPVSAALTDSKQFFDALAKGETAVRNPRLKGQKEYSPSGEELLFMAGGFRPLQEAVRGDIRENEAHITQQAAEKARPYLARIAQAYVIGGPSVDARIDRIVSEAAADKVMLTKDQIKNVAKNTQIDRVDVGAKKIKKSERGPVYEQIDSANRYFGALQ